MKETPIFRNIQHVPRIWGVTYPKAFGSLGVGLLFTTVAFASAGRASATQKDWRAGRRYLHHGGSLRSLLVAGQPRPA